ncbi:TIR domain-containing protein [Pseudoxanthomonas japonensis]|uniref:TIR domain-containing protein n=1 Tax=Pseudoxanthomonas japonensis TaxID=69284 RepID=UPI001BCE32AA|nr:TIR domain-containing protein [Pseudoxanthomonas japonensis]
MAYRNGTYVAFHAGGTTDPTASDIKYYNTIRMWSANKKVDFSIINSHEKTGAVRDTSSRETLRRALVARLNNSKHMVLILTATTKNDIDWVPFEIAHAIDNCKIPIIAAYPDYHSILAPHLLSDYWPAALRSRITNGTARVMHIPFKQAAVLDAIEQFSVFNLSYPTDGYGYYNREAHVQWGYLNP